MEATSTTLQSILLEASFYFLAVTSLIAFFLGCWAMVSPQSLQKLRLIFDQPFSLRRALKPLEVPRYQERFYYRLHKPVGLLVLLGSIYSLSVFLFVLGNEIPPSPFADPTHAVFWSILYRSGQIFLYIGNIGAMLIGIIMAVRPSILKPLELRANQWLSTRLFTRNLDINHSGVDPFLLQHQRGFALFLIISAIYIGANLLLYVSKTT